jgi:hypothetical protein
MEFWVSLKFQNKGYDIWKEMIATPFICLILHTPNQAAMPVLNTDHEKLLKWPIIFTLNSGYALQ